MVKDNWFSFSILSALLTWPPLVLSAGLSLILSRRLLAVPRHDLHGLIIESNLAVMANLPISVINTAAGFLLQGAVAYGVVAHLNGHRASFGDCAAVALRNAASLIVLAAIVAIGEYLGTFLLVIPGLVMATAWISAAPVLTIESKSVTRSLVRSAELTRNRRWPIFGLMLVYFIGALVIHTVARAAFRAWEASEPIMWRQWTTNLIVQPILSVLLGVVGAVGVASIYYELRLSKEGIGPEALAAVFD
jgi:hypothetical protein